MFTTAFMYLHDGQELILMFQLLIVGGGATRLDDGQHHGTLEEVTPVVGQELKEKLIQTRLDIWGGTLQVEGREEKKSSEFINTAWI